MRIYVIRHGESETNQRGCYTGWMQVNLTEKGYEDAKSIRPFLQNVTFDRVYTSDLIRAKQTAETALPGCTYEESTLLREYGMGTIEGQPAATVTVKNRDFTPFGGENLELVRARVKEFMEEVTKTDAKNVAVFTHAGWMRTVASIILQTEITKNVLHCGNCAIAILEVSDEKWQIHSWINR